MADISPKTSAICRKLKAELQISVDKQPKLCYNTNCGTAKAPMQGKHPHRRFYFVKKGETVMKEECGVFGVYCDKAADVAHEVYLGLYALQHRGQESVGISVCDDGIMRHRKGAGLVHEVFGEPELKELGTGNIAIGHVRYSTTGGGDTNNIQPLVVRHIKGNMSLAHNGNLTNAEQLRRRFVLGGAIFHGTSDTEAIA